jgi:hypothetical protein
MMTDRVASYAHDAIDLVATRLCGAEERARDVAATSLAKLEATQVQAKQKMGSTLGKLGAFVRTKPAGVLGCAFALGVVTAVVLRRR